MRMQNKVDLKKKPTIFPLFGSLALILYFYDKIKL